MPYDSARQFDPADRPPINVTPLGGREAPPPVAAPTADYSLRRAVLGRLVSDCLVRSGHIGVAAADGVVTLSGYVTSQAQKTAATAATRGVRGVQRVQDEVSVGVPAIHDAHPELEILDAWPPSQVADSEAALTVTPSPDARAIRPGLRL